MMRKEKTVNQKKHFENQNEKKETQTQKTNKKLRENPPF